MKRRKVSFRCGELKLEGEYYLPGGDGLFPAAVVCHPHPLYGGSMDNNVVRAISRALVERGMGALVFNFRGVGGSEGGFDGGRGEQDDVRSAMDWLRGQAEVDGERTGLVGYSFGATVALAVASSDERVKALALVSLPLMDRVQIEQAKSQMGNCGMPKLLVCGGEDFVVPPGAVGQVGEVVDSMEVRVIPGADHFWWGNEETVAHTVADFLRRYIG